MGNLTASLFRGSLLNNTRDNDSSNGHNSNNGSNSNNHNIPNSNSS